MEYALGVALLLVGGLAAFQFLSDSAAEQADQQAECISTRPPPPSCVRTPVPARPVPPEDPGSPEDPPPEDPAPEDPPPEEPPPEPTPRATLTAGTATASTGPNGDWQLRGPVTVTDPDGAAVPGAVVTARVLLGRQAVQVECTTSATGTCDLVAGPIPPDVTSATLGIVHIASDPVAVGGPYPTWVLTKP